MIQALEVSGNLTSFERPVIPLLVMAVVAIAFLVLAHTRTLNQEEVEPRPSRVR